jgi:ABC-type multidrug transport system ATPase subunit
LRVEARQLTKTFGSVTALRELCFEIPSGSRVALIGPNGSGKSTLNRVLMGLLRFRGEVLLDGRSPLDERAVSQRSVGYVPQIPPALGVPAGELVRALCELRSMAPSAVEKLAGRLGLGLERIARQPFRNLSGGMKQKLLIALALASRARLLILDEPTGSLDARSRERFFPLFEDLPAETTILLCSHRLEEVRQLVDHVLMLDDGGLAYDGPAAAFLEATTTSVLEVCADGEQATAWLVAHGFRRGNAGWWLRTVSHAEKLRLLPEIATELGAGLRDLNVRDLEALEIGNEGDDDALR